MEQLDNTNNRGCSFRNEGLVVQYALKQCPVRVKTIAKKFDLTIEQMAQICNGEHQKIEDYITILAYCLGVAMACRGKRKYLIIISKEKGLDIALEEVNRLIEGKTSNPIEYEKILHIICPLPLLIKKTKYKIKKTKYKGGGVKITKKDISAYYKQPYVNMTDGFNRVQDYEYGLTDT